MVYTSLLFTDTNEVYKELLETHLKTLLTLCDEARNTLDKSLSIKIEDMPHGSKWTPVVKNSASVENDVDKK